MPINPNAVHDTIVAHYRVMRARDARIDAQLNGGTWPKVQSITPPAPAGCRHESRPLHQYFLAKLAELLTPDQIETVKDG